MESKNDLLNCNFVFGMSEAIALLKKARSENDIKIQKDVAIEMLNEQENEDSKTVMMGMIAVYDDTLVKAQKTNFIPSNIELARMIALQLFVRGTADKWNYFQISKTADQIHEHYSTQVISDPNPHWDFIVGMWLANQKFLPFSVI